MTATTALLTLFLVGASGTSPGGRAEFSSLDQPPAPPTRVTKASAGTGGEEGRISAAEARDPSSALPRRTTLGGVTQQPIIRGALIGAVLGAMIGLVGGATAGAIMGGVVRALP
jgi:hypothetical protein